MCYINFEREKKYNSDLVIPVLELSHNLSSFRHHKYDEILNNIHLIYSYLKLNGTEITIR